MADEVPSADDRQLLERLDRYVDALHAADETSRMRLLEEHPELADLVSCLDGLENLSPVPPQSDGDYGSRKTVLVAPGAASADNRSDGELRSGMAAEDGRTFGKFRLLDEIGRGGMGVVYKALQTDLDRTVALKMILSSHLASPEEIRRFQIEAKAAGSLRHPHIVGIHEVGFVQGQHYFTMDYIEGRSLAEVLQSGPLDAETAARHLAAVARAVDYLHAHNIVHRDLKPSNVLIDTTGHPYITDFGLAKIFDPDNQHTQTGTVLGTASYMAPEQAAGRHSDVSPPSDVYSLGAILYEILTGRPPFLEDSVLETLVQVLESEPILPSKLNKNIPRELELICLRCLEKDPRKRYGSAAALADDLENYLRREPIDARPSGLEERLLRWARREPALVSRLSALALASIILQIHYLLRGTDLSLHFYFLGILGTWAAVSFVFQHILNRPQIGNWARFGWAAADSILFTAVLIRAEPPIGPLLIGYPALIAASGLFFRVRLVWFMTLISLISYAGLLQFRPEEAKPPHYPIIFAAVLAVHGFMVAYQVFRVRVLSRYFERGRVP